MDESQIIYLVVGFVIAIIGSVVADRKGYSVILWGVLCFVAGLFALVPLLIMPDRKKKAAEEVARLAVQTPTVNVNVVHPPAPAIAPDADRRPCPHCAEMIMPAANVCRYCGRDVTEAVI